MGEVLIMEELKSCPFCGGDAYLEQNEDHHGIFYSLGCSNDKCIANTIIYRMPDEELKMEEAVEQWNERSWM